MGPDTTKPKPGNEDDAVDQIEAENARAATDDQFDQEQPPEEPTRVVGDEKRRWYYIFKRPKFWLSAVALLLLALLFAWLIMPSRLWMVNTVGLRAQLDLSTLVETAEGTPPTLKQAQVTINGQQHHTDDTGRLKTTVPYGQLHIEVSKPGYETIVNDRLLDFDPFFFYLGGREADKAIRQQAFMMKSVGIPVRFVAKDWLTGQPIITGQFAIGDVVATPNAQGEVQLVIPATDNTTAQLTAKFGAQYADTTKEIPLQQIPSEITFVPAGMHYFVSKRSGQFAVYGSSLDGSAVAEVVPAAQGETGDITFSANPSGTHGVLASTREGTRDTFGSVQQKLYVVDLVSKKLTAVDTALRFAIVDWSADTVVYKAIVHTASGATVERLASYDVVRSKRAQLAEASTLAVVRVRLQNAVYLRGDNELRTVKIGGGAEKVLGTEVKKLAQTSANIFAYQIADGTWRQYDVNADQVSPATSPATPDRAFLSSTSADNQMFLVLDRVDGQPTLIAKSVGSGQETKLVAAPDLSAPIRWVGNVTVYRVGSADYVISAHGGTPKKISDVSATQTTTSPFLTFN